MLARIFFGIIGILFMIMVVKDIKKKKFFEKESFFWVLGTIIVLILSLFPSIIIVLSNLVGIDYAPSLLFLLAILFVLYLLFRQTKEVSLLKEQVKDLGERLVVLEKIIDENKDK